jgi:hypothetical protein
VSEWQPIETAPKDGTAVWLFYEQQIVIGYFQPPCLWDEAGSWFAKASFKRRSHERGLPDEIFGTYAFGSIPTHWMLLPEPPK